MSTITAVRAGLLLNSALYIVLVFVAGLLGGNGLAVKLAIATAGVSFLSYLAQDVVFEVNPGSAVERFAASTCLLSILLGLAAGLSLLV